LIYPQPTLRKSIIALVDLLNHRPLQYVLGKTWFYNLQFSANENVLIPRPETEEMLEKIIAQLKINKWETPQILDIGTGSGCLPIVIKKEFPAAYVESVDVSEEALKLAALNAQAAKVEIHLQHIDFFRRKAMALIKKIQYHR
jgi:release factor glutamine methyltransferase